MNEIEFLYGMHINLCFEEFLSKNTTTDGGSTATHSKAITVWDMILLRKQVLKEYLAYRSLIYNQMVKENKPAYE